MVMLCAAAAAAEAAVVCATPQEMKVLQSAALQQQLMVAALTCHMSEDYNSFVNGNRSRLIQSDNELKAFFTARRRGEDYNTYKTRIANSASLHSLHDPQFCDSARKVFDMALGRGSEQGGLAPEPPRLIDTGYEGCRPVQDELLTAKAESKPVEARVASLQAARPAAIPVPKPLPTPEARHALALADNVDVPVPQSAPRAAAKPKAIASVPVARPAQRVAELPSLRNVDVAPHNVVPPIVGPDGTTPPKHLTHIARAELPNVRGSAEVPQNLSRDEPQSSAQDEPQDDANQNTAVQRYADNEQSDRVYDPPAQDVAPPRDDYRQRYADDEQSDRDYGPPPQEDVAPQQEDYRQRYAEDDRSRWNEPAFDDRRGTSRRNDERNSDDNVPNAYRPGTVWVGDARPAWGQVSYYPPPPRGWHPPPRRHLVRGPDGRWYVVIGRHAHWVRD